MRDYETRAGRRIGSAWMCSAAMAVVLTIGSLLAPVAVPAARADEPVEKKAERPTVDAADVYLGDAATFRKPAEVDASAVYREISEYQKIIEDEVEPGSARYELLMNKASKRFKCALRKVARAGGYDLVASSGAVRNASDVPDITQDVIDHL